MGWCAGACGPRLGMWGLMPACCRTLGHAEDRRWTAPVVCVPARRGGRRGGAPGLRAGEHAGMLGLMLPPTPSLRCWDVLVPFSPLRAVTHPSSYRFLGPQRGDSGCRGRRQPPCPAGRSRTVRGPGGVPHRTSTPHHPARLGWPGPGLAQSSGQSRPSSPGSGLHAASTRIGAHRSAGGQQKGSLHHEGQSHAAHVQESGRCSVECICTGMHARTHTRLCQHHLGATSQPSISQVYRIHNAHPCLLCTHFFALAARSPCCTFSPGTHSMTRPQNSCLLDPARWDCPQHAQLGLAPESHHLVCKLFPPSPLSTYCLFWKSRPKSPPPAVVFSLRSSLELV